MLDVLMAVLDALDCAYPLTLRDKDGEIRPFWIVVAIAVPFFVVSALIFAALVFIGGR